MIRPEALVLHVRSRIRARGVALAAAASICVGAAIVGGVAANEGLAQSSSAQKESVDERLRRAESRLSRARAREEVLTDQVQAFNDDIRALEIELAPLRARREAAESRAAQLKARLNALTRRLEVEKKRLAEAEDALVERRVLLAQRLRDVYVRGEPDPILVLIESESVTGAIQSVETLELVVETDRKLVGSVQRFRDESERTKQLIARVRADVAVAENEAEEAAAAARAAAADLERQVTVKDGLRDGRRQLLSQARGDRENIEAETQDLQRRSAALASKIVAAQGQSATQVAPTGQAPSTGPASSSGFIWPVNGTLTSGFGPRWGRMHEGIDISGGSGTPIATAASGTVILAGWQGGYGQLVVVDHGGGISTAYAHLSSIGVSVGQSVSQGTSVGGMGTTGNSTGVHLHFEVRVNGGAVNPLGYL